MTRSLPPRGGGLGRGAGAGPPTLTRRTLLTTLAATFAARPTRAQAPIPVGAIRWDAWHAPGSVPTDAVTRALTPPAYRHRLPFFAEVTGDTVAINGATQPIMDREIELARRAGLSFWAFLGYPRESSMSAGLHLYLTSRQRRGLRFCIASELVQWGFARDGLSPVARWHIELLRHPDYQRLGTRPLYFLGFLSDRLVSERWGDLAALRAATDRFRAEAVRSGAGDPFIVLMARPEDAARYLPALGADGASAYAIAGSDPAAPYAALAALVERRWDDYAALGLPTLPLVMSGWDRRPRIEHPMPWERWQRPGAGIDRYYAAPTPAELANHLRRALAWIEAHPAAPRAALIYAWNENDEGGWLVPTHPFDDTRLGAIRAVLCPAGCG